MPFYVAGRWPEGAKDDDDAFWKALLRENRQTDHLGAILRGMAYIDALLLTILENHLKNLEQMNARRRRFMEKASFAHAVSAIDESLLTSLGELAKIRNKFAHDIGRQLNHVRLTLFATVLTGERWSCFFAIPAAVQEARSESVMPSLF